MFLASLEIKRACVMYWVIPFLVGVRVVLVGPVGSMACSQSPFRYPGVFRCTTGGRGRGHLCNRTDIGLYCAWNGLNYLRLVRSGWGWGQRPPVSLARPLRGPPASFYPEEKNPLEQDLSPGSSFTLLCVCVGIVKSSPTQTPSLPVRVVGTEQFLSLFS